MPKFTIEQEVVYRVKYEVEAESAQWAYYKVMQGVPIPDDAPREFFSATPVIRVCGEDGRNIDIEKYKKQFPDKTHEYLKRGEING